MKSDLWDVYHVDGGDDDSGTQGNDVIESIDLVLRRVQMPREQF